MMLGVNHPSVFTMVASDDRNIAELNAQQHQRIPRRTLNRQPLPSTQGLQDGGAVVVAE